MIEKSIKIIGHRGARDLWPENTLTGFRYAMDLKVDAIEMDLLATSDKQIVVTHDFSPNPDIIQKFDPVDPAKVIFPSHLPQETMVKNMTLKELRSYLCGLKKHPRYPNQNTIPDGEPIPCLSDVLKLIKDAKSSIELILEIKTLPGDHGKAYPPEVITPLVIDEIQKFGLSEQIIIQSFDSRVLKRAQSICKNIRTSQLLDANYLDPKHLIPILKSNGVSYASPKWQWTTAEMIEVFHQHKISVYPWTANDEKSWQSLIDLGVDGIITDAPEKLMRYLVTVAKLFDFSSCHS